PASTVWDGRASYGNRKTPCGTSASKNSRRLRSVLGTVTCHKTTQRIRNWECGFPTNVSLEGEASYLPIASRSSKRSASCGTPWTPPGSDGSGSSKRSKHAKDTPTSHKATSKTHN